MFVVLFRKQEKQNPKITHNIKHGSVREGGGVNEGNFYKEYWRKGTNLEPVNIYDIINKKKSRSLVDGHVPSGTILVGWDISVVFLWEYVGVVVFIEGSFSSIITFHDF